MAKYYEAYLLAAWFILGCYLCDKHLEEIGPSKWLVWLYDGTTVTIIRKFNKTLFNAGRYLNNGNKLPPSGEINQRYM